MLRQPLIRAALAACALLLASCAQEPSPEATRTDATPRAAENQEAGVRAFVDPVTGALREPTPEEAAALAKGQQKAPDAQSRPVQKPREIVHPDGTVEVILDGSHDQPVQACVQADGGVKVEHACPSETDKK
jgi:hypothetical protein